MLSRSLSASCLCAALCLISTASWADLPNNLYILISPPRALSTAFLKMISSGGDLTTVNEVFEKPYCCKHFPNDADAIYQADAPGSYAAAEQLLRQKLESGPVFTKELSFTIEEFLQQKTDLIRDPKVYFILLTRNPHHSVISYYLKRHKSAFSSRNTEGFYNGFVSLYQIADLLRSHGAQNVHFVQAEELYMSPETTVRGVLEFMKLPFKNAYLDWTDYNQNTQTTWTDAKHKGHQDYFHGTAIQSHGFGKPKDYQVDADGRPTFSEIPAEERESVEALYRYNLPFYEQLLTWYRSPL